MKIATPKGCIHLKDVYILIGKKVVGCVSLSIGKRIIFLKFLKFSSFGNIHKVRTL